MTLYALIFGFAFLLSADPDSSAGLMRAPAEGGKSYVRLFLEESIELLCHTLALILLYAWGVAPYLGAGEPSLPVMIFLPAAYAMSAVRKRSDLFAAVVFGICVLTALPQDGSGSPFFPAGYLKVLLCIFFIRILFLGLRERLRISFVPERVAGVPVLFLGAALLALVFWGFQGVIPLVLKLIEMPAEKITIMDYVDNRNRVKDALAKGVHYVTDRITETNYKELLAKYVGSGDLIIDLAWNIECAAMLSWCREQNILYVNTSVEEWDPYKDTQRNDPTKYTLYARHMELRKLIDSWGSNNGTTAVVDHGANPGLVSHFTKHALLEIAKKIVAEKPADPRVKDLEKAISEKAFAKLAQLSGLKTIHISERDTQITDRPKEVNEFVNTWSIEGFFEEGVAPAELGWGTHERLIPRNAFFHKEGPRNQICLSTLGMKTWVRSWVPCGEITGMVVRHGEAFSISDRLTVWENGQAVYRPTVHYAYCPSDVAINSLHELEMRQFRLQEKQRIMSDEIISGRDELGVLLMGHDFNSWWCGSLLDIDETRRLVPHQNATTLQVAISVVAAAIWMIKNPKRGFCLPDDIDHEEILKVSIPYMQPFVSYPVDWTPLKNMNTKFTKFDIAKPSDEDAWQFTTFLVDQRERLNVYEAKNSQPEFQASKT